MFNPSQNLLGKFRCLSQKSDCLLFALARTLALAVSANFSLACLSSLYRFQGSRRCLCSRADNVDYYSLSLRFCQQLFSTFFLPIYYHPFQALFLTIIFYFSRKTGNPHQTLLRIYCHPLPLLSLLPAAIRAFPSESCAPRRFSSILILSFRHEDHLFDRRVPFLNIINRYTGYDLKQMEEFIRDDLKNTSD